MNKLNILSFTLRIIIIISIIIALTVVTEELTLCFTGEVFSRERLTTAANIFCMGICTNELIKLFKEFITDITSEEHNDKI